MHVPYRYFTEIIIPNCDIHSGVPQDDPNELNCANPEDKCQVSSY